jgi:lysophospholipase L1-like esterase
LAHVVGECGRVAELPVVDVFGLMSPEDLLSDGLHPNVSGHEKLYRLIAQVIFAAPSLGDYE